MFKNRSLQVQMVKTPKNDSPSEFDTPQPDRFDKTQAFVEKHSSKAMIVLVAAYSFIKVLNTTCEIAVNAAPKKH